MRVSSLLKNSSKGRNESILIIFKQ